MTPSLNPIGTTRPAPSTRWIARHPLVVGAACMLAMALVLRAPQFGNPINGLDEQFYLLVGDRMWQGALPFVDLWDRKPVGLFLLFAAIRLLPGDGVVAAQVVATLFAAATGFVVMLLARRSAPAVPAAMAGLVYLTGVVQLWGETTQTPVFYNLFTALAALLTLNGARDPQSSAGRWSALGAMALAGLAVQIKTIAVIEGAFFGCWLVAAHWRVARDPRRTAAFALMLAASGAFPTLAAMAGYALLGHFDAWWQANVLSILAKGAPLDPDALKRLGGTAAVAAPILAVAATGLWRHTERFRHLSGETWFQLGWIAAATLDFLAIGGFWSHYALPLLLACAPLTAHAFAMPGRGRALFAILVAGPLLYALLLSPRNAALDRAIAAEVTAAIPEDVRTRCLFIYEGPVAYYQLTHACLVTPYAFTAHLRSAREAPALGVDPHAALLSALDRRPGTIITIENSPWTDRYLPNERLLENRLASAYRRIAVLPHRSYGGPERLILWRLRGLPND